MTPENSTWDKSMQPAERASVVPGAVSGTSVPIALPKRDDPADLSPPISPQGLPSLPLIDQFGRIHRSLRISVTDRCNIRCQYCMPEIASFLPQHALLSFDEITQFVRVVMAMGIRDVRITGGEPLMRPQLPDLLRRLVNIPELNDLALTTNGMLLADQLPQLVSAGLRRVNISLDTLSEAVFRRLSRRAGLDQVLAGIDAAAREPAVQVRLNALVMRDVNFDEVLDLVEFARERSIAIRFIEFMPLDAERLWNRTQMVSGAEMRARLSVRFGTLVPLDRRDSSQPSTDYTFADGSGVVGFIDSVSQPFCGACDRLRLTADGKLRNCLFGLEEWDMRGLLRQANSTPATAGEDGLEMTKALESTVRACLAAKRAAHGIDAVDFAPPERAMFQIGG